MSTSVHGVDDGAGFGVSGTATSGDGVIGTTRGVRKVGIRGIHTGHFNAIAIRGELGRGTAAILGQTGGTSSGVETDDVLGSGVWGDSTQGPGVSGTSSVAPGLLGFGQVAVRGTSTKTESFDPPGVGVHGISTAASNGIGILGEGGRAGVHGKSNGGNGVRAESVGSPAALQVDNTGDFSAVLIFQEGSGRFITCRAPQNRDLFTVENSGEVHAVGDVKVRGVALTCDRNAKANLTSVDARQILQKLACMPIQNWSYKTDPASVRHIGPTSQDFQSAFGLNGDDDVHISAVDAQGIALAAIQGLNEKLQAENAELRTNLASLEARLTALESVA
jgi:hypothetical protein